jgi:hypothetical protein
LIDGLPMRPIVTVASALDGGLWKQAIQDLLVATVQNLRKLVRHLSETDLAIFGHCQSLPSPAVKMPMHHFHEVRLSGQGTRELLTSIVINSNVL